MNVTEPFDVIAAFADGERVDTEALRAALAAEAGRDYLIDLVAMRELVGQAAAAETMSPPARAAGTWRITIRGLAAALLLAVGLAGYAVGRQRADVVQIAVLPPLEADVVVAMEAPPAPTQIIQLGSGVPDGGGR